MANEKFNRAIFEALAPEYDGMIPGTSEHVFSPEFERKMQKLISRREKPYYLIINTVGKRAACVMLAVLIAFTVTVMNVDALRYAFHGFIIYSSRKYSYFEPTDAGNAPETIEDIYEITYDLSGYEKEVWLDEYYQRSTHYIKDDVYYVGLSQGVKGIYIPEMNTEGAVISTIPINGHEAIYYRDKDNYDVIIWDNGDYIFVLHSNIGKDILIEIAESLKKAE